MSEHASANIIDVGEADFERDVLQASKDRPVVVDFWAPWCGPCRMLGPVLEKLVAARNGAVVLAKVNVDTAQRLAAAFGIEGIPAVKAFRDGRVVSEFVGVLAERQLIQFLDSLAPSQGEQLLKQAALTEDPTQAEKLYRQALEQDRNLDSARLELAKLLLKRNKLDEIDDLLEPFSGEGERGEEAQGLKAQAFLRQNAAKLGSLNELRRQQTAEPASARHRYDLGLALAAAGNYAEALPLLLSAAERDLKLASGPVREAMVQVFIAMGVRHPLADEYRRKLSELLY